MHWTDEGVVLGVRKHGESSVILELMTREHGRHLGLVHGGRSKTLQAVLQPGNTVQATWRARLDEHLGTYQVEGLNLRAARLMGSSMALYGLATLAHLLRYFPVSIIKVQRVGKMSICSKKQASLLRHHF